MLTVTNRRRFQNSILLFCVIMVVALTSSCKKDKGDSTPIKGIIITGTWKINYCLDDGHDDSHEFEDFTFVFNNDGVLTAASDSATVVGTWEADDSDEREFHIYLGHTPPLDHLTRDWEIKSMDAEEIQLIQDEDSYHDSIEVHFKKQ